MQCQSFVSGDTYGVPVPFVNPDKSVVNTAGCQAEILWVDQFGNLVLWLGTSGRSAPVPNPTVTGAITNTAPSTGIMQVTPIALALPVGAYQGQVHFWDASGNLESSKLSAWVINITDSAGP